MEALKLLTEMGWPAAVAIVGVGASISVAAFVRGVSKREMEKTRLRATRDVETARIAASKTNGAITIPHARDSD